MPGKKTTFGFTVSIPADPEGLGPSLAHVVKIENNREILLGQAWLAGPNSLITCGHVVEPFLRNPGSVVVKFPASGNRYAVQSIRLHPSFVRQPDQLVKFDVALLTVTLAHPETIARPLPFAYERGLHVSQPLSTVRYPVHLGQLSAAPQPLAQEGRYLGQLRKHDSFHLLHDLALSPGDSGAPIFDGPLVVGIHCGDTATLPGLNLPTTSIRLSLWVDALRELGLVETGAGLAGSKMRPWMTAALIFLVSLVLTVSAVCASVVPPTEAKWSVQQPAILPVDISFNKSLKGYKLGDPVQIVIIPRSDCWLYLFDVDENNQVLTLYPPHGLPAFVKAGQSRTIDRFGSLLLAVNDAKDKLHVVALNSDFPIVSKSDWSEFDPAGHPLRIDGDELTERIQHFLKAEPRNILHLELDAPTAR